MYTHTYIHTHTHTHTQIPSIVPPRPVRLLNCKYCCTFDEYSVKNRRLFISSRGLMVYYRVYGSPPEQDESSPHLHNLFLSDPY
jgi:hypothetical protein